MRMRKSYTWEYFFGAALIFAAFHPALAWAADAVAQTVSYGGAQVLAGNVLKYMSDGNTLMASAGVSVTIRELLEHTIMQAAWMPQWLKPVLGSLFSVLGFAAVGLAGGMPPAQILAGAIASPGGTVLWHKALGFVPGVLGNIATAVVKPGQPGDVTPEQVIAWKSKGDARGNLYDSAGHLLQMLVLCIGVLALAGSARAEFNSQTGLYWNPTTAESTQNWQTIKAQQLRYYQLKNDAANSHSEAAYASATAQALFPIQKAWLENNQAFDVLKKNGDPAVALRLLELAQTDAESEKERTAGPMGSKKCLEIIGKNLDAAKKRSGIK